MLLSLFIIINIVIVVRYSCYQLLLSLLIQVPFLRSCDEDYLDTDGADHILRLCEQAFKQPLEFPTVGIDSLLEQVTNQLLMVWFPSSFQFFQKSILDEQNNSNSNRKRCKAKRINRNSLGLRLAPVTVGTLGYAKIEKISLCMHFSVFHSKIFRWLIFTRGTSLWISALRLTQ